MHREARHRITTRFTAVLMPVRPALVALWDMVTAAATADFSEGDTAPVMWAGCGLSRTALPPLVDTSSRQNEATTGRRVGTLVGWLKQRSRITWSRCGQQLASAAAKGPAGMEAASKQGAGSHGAATAPMPTTAGQRGMRRVAMRQIVAAVSCQWRSDWQDKKPEVQWDTKACTLAHRSSIVSLRSSNEPDASAGAGWVE